MYIPLRLGCADTRYLKCKGHIKLPAACLRTLTLTNPGVFQRTRTVKKLPLLCLADTSISVTQTSIGLLRKSRAPRTPLPSHSRTPLLRWWLERVRGERGADPPWD
jgi:hypothetical protein